MNLSDRDRRILAKILQGMERPVRLVLATDDGDTDGTVTPNAMARDLIQHLTGLTPLIVAHLSSAADPLLPPSIVVDRTPTLLIQTAEGSDTGIRYVGVPSGYQFGTLVDTILDVSREAHRLEATTVATATQLMAPVRIRVYYLPTCPHSPRAVRLAHMLAWCNPQRILGEAMDASVYPDAAVADGVEGVPTFVCERQSDGVRDTLQGGQTEERLRQVLNQLMD